MESHTSASQENTVSTDERQVPPPASSTHGVVNTNIPSDRTVRNVGRAQKKSHEHFMNLLASTSRGFLNTEVREASAVQIALNQSLGDCDQYIKVLTARLQYGNDSPTEKELYSRELDSCTLVKVAIPKAYADRIEELSIQSDRDNNSSSTPLQDQHSRTSKSRSNKSALTSSSKKSKRARDAERRLEELRLEEEAEARRLQLEQEAEARRLEQERQAEARRLEREKEKLRLRYELEDDDSDDDSQDGVESVYVSVHSSEGNQHVETTSVDPIRPANGGSSVINNDSNNKVPNSGTLINNPPTSNIVNVGNNLNKHSDPGTTIRIVPPANNVINGGISTNNHSTNTHAHTRGTHVTDIPNAGTHSNIPPANYVRFQGNNVNNHITRNNVLSQHNNQEFQQANYSNNSNLPPLQQPTVQAESAVFDKFMHLNVMDRRSIKFDGDPLQYIPFKNEFDLLIQRFPGDPHYLFHELLASLQGSALEAVVFCRNLLNNPDKHLALNTALRVLERNFGSSYQVRQAHLNKITNRSKKVNWDAPSMRSFLGELEECKTLLSSPSQRIYLDSTETVMAVVDRMPSNCKRSFLKSCASIQNGDPSNPGFDFLVRFVEGELAQLQIVFADLLVDSNNHRPKHRQQKEKNGKLPGKHLQYSFSQEKENHSSISSANASTGKGSGQAAGNSKKDSSSTPPTKPCHCCNQVGHRLQDCPTFNNKSVEQRWEFIKKNNHICKSCFGSHGSSQCRSRYSCKYCRQMEHHSKLCRKNKDSQGTTASAEVVQESPTSSEVQPSEVTAHTNLTSGSPVYVRVVPITAFTSSNKQMDLYALLDSGSDTTLGTMKLAETLKLPGKKLQLNLQGVNERKTMNALDVSFSIKGKQGHENSFVLKSVTCVSSLPTHCNSIPSSDVTSRYPHLKDIKFPEVLSTRIDLIIGADNEHLHAVLESRFAEGSNLHAYRTPLGWVLAGVDDQTASASTRVINASTLRTSTSNRVLQSDGVIDISDHAMQAVKDMVHQCVEAKDDEEQACSAEDEEVVRIFEQERTKDEDGHIRLPLPLKDKNVIIPNNRSLAESRLKSLKVKLLKNPELLEIYASKMDNLKDKGHMRGVHASAQKKNSLSEPMVVYIVHFMTQQVKPRLVMDAAATHLGRSLNSYLMQGPDLMQPLVDVLIRFRQDSVAFACDIKEMYHQVRLPVNGRVSLRLLWFKNNDPNDEVEEFEFTVHAFGLKSSPAAANFSVRQTAIDNECGASDKTVQTMLRQLYVDDCLNSEQSVDDALIRIKELNQLAATSAFKFVKYTSNRKEVLNSLDEQLLLPNIRELNLRHDGIPTHKALGVYWDPASDTLTFRINVHSKPETKRGILSMLSQVFDPLGLALPYLMSGRRIMQEAFAGSGNSDWDSPLPNNIRKKWNHWLKDLPQLENIEVPRCYHVNEKRADVYELHTFGDASNVGVGAVCFLRYRRDDVWNCAFIRGRGHILPKNVNWPTARHELEAAVMASQLQTNVLRAIEIPISKSSMWSDSATVLAWIRNKTHRPKVFVYNRRKEILRHTEIGQWSYVNTAHNPADLASRGVPTKKISSDSLWLKGPDFLRHNEDNWPDWCLPTVNMEDLELTTTVQTADAEVATISRSSQAIDLTPAQKLYALLWKYSSLNMLLRVTARLISLSSKSKVDKLTSTELEAALIQVIRLAQEEYFSQPVVNAIKTVGFNAVLSSCKDKVIKHKLAGIQKLSPFVDQNSILRVGGRLQHAELPYDTMHPIILPSRHHVTQLIIDDVHIKNRHFGGMQYTLNVLKVRFWITQSTVKFYLDRCLPCQILRAKTGSQMMAPLPADRVTVGKCPFSATGVDYFGPIVVRVKRSAVKRWIALFTCMATRAIHLEKVYSLSTSSFLQAFFRFRDSRGGAIKTLYSDNATTFHGADAELKKAIERLESDGFGEKLLQQGIDWKFNPPLASHQGGVWERQIRSVRKVLLGIPAFERLVPTDELLDTVLKEAEYIVNNRPLTKIDGEIDSIPALTPNMLLTGSLDSASPIDEFHDSDQFKRDWRFTQVAADQFWQRFTREYLVNLQQRSKWFDSLPNMKIGDVVLVKESRFNHRPNYPKAVITKLHLGTDGLVRSVQLRFADGRMLVRDVRKIVPLECAYNEALSL